MEGTRRILRGTLLANDSSHEQGNGDEAQRVVGNREILRERERCHTQRRLRLRGVGCGVSSDGGLEGEREMEEG